MLHKLYLGQPAYNQTLRKRMASTEFVHEHEPPANIALQTAAMRGDIEGLRNLIGQGVDVNFREPLKSTALNIAADYGQLAAVELLLAAGADADARDDNHESALFTAAAHGRQRIARALLDAGAAADVRVALFYGRRSVLKVLLRAGSDIEDDVDSDASRKRMRRRQRGGFAGGSAGCSSCSSIVFLRLPGHLGRGHRRGGLQVEDT